MKYLFIVLISCCSVFHLSHNAYATGILDDLAECGYIDKDYKEQEQKRAQQFREQVQKEQQEKANISKK